MNEPNLTAFLLWAAGSVLLGILFFLATGRDLSRKTRAAAAGLAVVLGFLGARLLYAGVRLDWFAEIGFENLLWPVDEAHNYWADAQGFALWGAVGGAALAALAAARLTGGKAALILDRMAPAGALIIALCRFGEFWIGEGIGMSVENEALWFFPVAVVSEWDANYAVFMLEGLTALVILILTLRSRYPAGSGNRARLFLILYGASQILLESFRRDSYLRWLLMKVNQPLCALVLAGLIAAVLIRRRKEGPGRRPGRREALLCGGFLLCVLIVAGLEFDMDKYGILPLWVDFCVEGVCCAAMGWIAAWTVLPAKEEGAKA